MAKYEMGLQDYLRVIKKRFWIILFTTVTVYLFALVYTQLQPKVYEARGTVELIQHTTIGGFFENTILRSGDIIATATKVIRSSRVIGKVVDELRARKMLETLADEDERQRQIESLKGLISAAQLERTNILVITVRHGDPELCREIVNTVARVFCSEDQSADQEQSRAMRLHLTEQIQQVSASLMEAERQLESYNRSHGYPELTREELLDLDQAAELEAQLKQAAARRAEQENRLRQLRGALDPAALASLELGELAEAPTVAAVHQELVRLNTRLAELLEDYTPRHPAVIEAEKQIDDKRKELALAVRPVVAGRIETLTRELEELRAREGVLAGKLGRFQSRLNTMPRDRLELAQLKRRVEVNTRLFLTFNERLEEMKLAEASKAGGIRLLDPATLPIEPIYPKTSTNAMAGIIIGVLLGLAFAFVIESMDTSIGTIEDVETYVQKPVLGVIPFINVDEEKLSKFQKKIVAVNEEFNERQSKLVSISDPKSPVTEAYRTLRTNLQFSFLQKQGGKALLVTSATPQEGKTTTITNLAVIFAQGGKKTLILSCNLRHPTVYKIFGLKKKPGITDILVGSVPWREALQDPGIDNLKVLAAGPYPPNPSELLDSPPFTRLLAELKEVFDIILIDSPPVLPVTDAAVIGSKADGILLIYFAGKAAREALLRAKLQLENVNGRILGVVLNRIQPEGKLGYTYYYQYQYKYYGPKEPAI